MTKTCAIAMLVAGMFLSVLGCDKDQRDSAAQAQAAEAGGATKPKELVLDLGDTVTLKLVQIPAGTFTMGSPEAEKQAALKEAVAAGVSEDAAQKEFADEVQHEVTISKPFYMGITPVTVEQFAAFVKDSGYRTDAEKEGWSIGLEIKGGEFEVNIGDWSWRKPGFDQKGDHPVVHVSWNDAKAFCEWLSKKSGKTVVLPSEAQWEYACRAGTKTAYPWGDNPDDGAGWANAADQSLKKQIPNQKGWAFFSWDDGFVFTSPVGRFKANAFGLYDMIGNVWEWCEDRYRAYPRQSQIDPKGPNSGSLRVLRGGSWSDLPRVCRSAGRGRLLPVRRYGDDGFRVAVVSAGVGTGSRHGWRASVMTWVARSG